MPMASNLSTRSKDTMIRATFYARRGKRWCDAAAAFGGLVAFLPLLILIGLLVRWRLGKPVIFSHIRIGRGGKPFRIVKFRTMTEETDDQGQHLPDEKRLTRLGRVLRATSLDELPELWNILRGEMSFVGPRPLLPEYLEHYTAEESRRHDVTPGLTGWAQVNGRNAIGWEERFRLDVWYVDHLSLGLDVKIAAMTFGKVFTGSGVAAAGHATMPKFSRSPAGAPQGG
jgi:lipopolysaccharide/colanic/teichoic acid biosynthesis glycosyltransferase